MGWQVLTATDGLSREEWLEFRRQGIGGSDAGAIAGVSKYASPFSVWADKRGVGVESNAGDAAQWGHDLEHPVAQRFAKDYNLAVVRWPVMLQSTERPWQLANVDYFIVEPSSLYPRSIVTDALVEPDNILAILEVKTTGIASRGNAQGWVGDSVPASYEYQGLHYSCVTGISQVTFACLVAGQGLVVRERDFSTSAQSMLNKLEAEFWQSVESGEAPDPLGYDVELDIIKSQYPVSVEGEVVEVGEKEAQLVEQYRELKAQADELDREMKSIKAALEIIVGDAESVSYDGQTLYTYKSTKPRETFDAKALKQAHPDIHRQFVSETQGYRVLRLKGE